MGYLNTHRDPLRRGFMLFLRFSSTMRRGRNTLADATISYPHEVGRCDATGRERGWSAVAFQSSKELGLTRLDAPSLVPGRTGRGGDEPNAGGERRRSAVCRRIARTVRVADARNGRMRPGRCEMPGGTPGTYGAPTVHPMCTANRSALRGPRDRWRAAPDEHAKS